MTLSGFVARNALRNKRRSALTVVSIAFSLLLLTLMMTVWRSFYLQNGSAQSAQRLLTRHRVSLAFFLPSYYREKIRAIPGVVSVAPMTWYGGLYKDDRPENFFAQFATDPDEIIKSYPENHVPAEQLAAWKRDRAGCMVDAQLARKHGWRLGDRVVIQGTIFPLELNLTVRAIYTSPFPSDTLFFDERYLREGVSWMKGQSGFFAVLTESPQSVARVSAALDEMFHNSPQPTKTETEKAFQLDFIATLGNVKAFILGICAAVVFTTLLVTANTMAMSIRERTREVAVLKAVGFTQQDILVLFSCEAVGLAITGGALGALAASILARVISKAPEMSALFVDIKVNPTTIATALGVAAAVGLLSGVLPSYRASRVEIAQGLRYVG
ncbi:MAG TPA: FtsX-like permease family protein [Terriglobales bacterium]|nr:FtsX-like permease family protein [Terriglobales bacterium]